MGRNVNAVFAIKSRIPYQSLPAKTGIAFPSASTNPIIKPEATIAGCKIEKWLHKHIPEMIDLFVTPFCTVLLTAFLTLGQILFLTF